MIRRIEPTDSLDLINHTLEEYGTSLFDTAYFFALAVSDEFYPQKFEGMNNKEKTEALSDLEKAKTILTKHDYSNKFIRPIQEEISALKQAVIPKRKGKFLETKTKIILLWAELLTKNKMMKMYLRPISKIPESEIRCSEAFLRKLPEDKRLFIQIDKENIIEGEEIKIVELAERAIDWDNIRRLLEWYKKRLGKCLYKSNLNTDKDIEKENEKLKLRYHKSYWAYNNSIYIVTSPHEQTQEYFKMKEKMLPIRITYKDLFFSDAYPSVLVKFNNKSIELGELRENGVIIEKHKFTQDLKVKKEAPIIEKDLSLNASTIIFPNGEIFPPS
ncbi:hypothetical protein ACFLRX_04895 [Acidobacteriota bacterium]